MEDMKEAEAKEWNVHDANLALYSALTGAVLPSSTRLDRKLHTVRSSIPKCRKLYLPPEILLQILNDRTRWILTSFSSVRVVEHQQNDSWEWRGGHRYYRPGYDFPIRIFHTKALSAKEVKHMRRIIFLFTGERRNAPKYLKEGIKWSSLYELAVRSKENDCKIDSFRSDKWWDWHAGDQIETYRYEF